MRFFSIENNKMVLLNDVNFTREKDMQQLVESNLDILFEIQFISSEFRIHSIDRNYRFDTLAFNPDTNKAPSIGSPWTIHSEFLYSSEASLHNTAALMVSDRSGSSSESTFIPDDDIEPCGS